MKLKTFLKIAVFSVISTFIFYSINAVEKIDPKKHEQSVIKQRNEKNRYFKTSPVSPMAGFKRITLPESSKQFLSYQSGELIFSDAKSIKHEAEIYFRRGKWRLLRKRDDSIEELTGFRSTKLGKFTLKYYPVKGTIVLVFFNPDRDKIKKFKHLFYYPPDIGYRVKGKLILFKKPERIMVPTSRKLEKPFFRYGKFKFRLKGKDFELTVLKSSLDQKDNDSKYLFIPFADKTSGIETYEGGRFIEMDEPEGNEMILDFNLCFNPLCNYADVYNCPLPPFENELNIEIKAGEKTYPH